MRWLMAGALSSLLALSGCANMMSYSVSEATLERHVKQAVVDFDREQLRAGSPLALELDTTNVTLGPQGRNVIRLDVTGQVSITAFASRLPADIALSLEGTPYYDSDERAVYLRRLQLLDSHIDAPGLPVDLLPSASWPPVSWRRFSRACRCIGWMTPAGGSEPWRATWLCMSKPDDWYSSRPNSLGWTVSIPAIKSSSR